ncbi:endo-1,4-beta-xylanase [Marinicrinis lubricantis]|uniref:Beta-xylanase n=1 Tax=Marinicrinis lubricantis TaxID=2086470 RepID=A0ABW1IQF1_9BACL
MKRTMKRVICVMLAAALFIPIGWLAPAARAETTASTESADQKVIYHETFKDGMGAAKPSGGAILMAVTGKGFDGNDDGAALYVNHRANNWDAADFFYADMGLKDGGTYTVTAQVYVDASVTVPAGAQAYLQTADQSYAFLAGADFKAGEAVTLSKEFTLDSSTGDTRIRIQSNDEGAGVPFYIGEIWITEKGSSEEPPRPPAKAFAAITFEDQSFSGFTGRAGTETLTVTDEANHTEGGKYALKVEGRSENWHGPSLRVEQYVDLGYEYKISAWVKLIEPASSQLQLSTQVADGSSANYVNLAAKTIGVSDGWVLFEGTYRYTNAGGEYLTIYIESANQSTASFYIDDIRFERTGSGPVDIQRDLMPIKEVYQDDFLFGNAITAEDLEGVRFELLTMHHNLATAGNAMKPDALQRTKGSFTFEAADQMVNQILDAGMKMHGHVLVWHQQSPDWMNTAQDAEGNTVYLDREAALENLRTHIRTVVEHFGERVISWDVVNEAMNDNPPNPDDWEASLRQSPWYHAIGPDYIEQAFLAAREVLDEKGWDIKLYYNDYNDDNQNKALAIYNMVKEINERYAEQHPGQRLIDGIGMQGHYSVNTNPANVEKSLERFISLGVEVGITELDIQAGSNYQLSEAEANAQGYLYAQLFNIYKAHAEHISRVTVWGLDDGSSWRSATNPTLFDKNLQAKPAYDAVIDPVKFTQDYDPEDKEATQSTAAYGTPVIDGEIDEVWSQTAEMTVDRYQMAWQGASGIAKALWDEANLYVLIQVSDTQLDKSNANAWEQDSVEVFLDQNNAKTSFYEEDDGQYRVGFAGDTSFNPPSISEGFESQSKVTGTSYTVEMKIPITAVTPADGAKLGFDVQINDAKDGVRQSVATWNDMTGMGYTDPSVFGVLTLNNDEGPGSGGGGYTGGVWIPRIETVEFQVKDGIVTIKPAFQTINGRTTATITNKDLQRALDQAAAQANGKKQIVIELLEPANGESFEVKLPAPSLQGQGDFVLRIKTEMAVVEVPSNMLSNRLEEAEQVSIGIAKASPEVLDAAAQERIGDRPVIELSLEVDGQVIAWNNPDAPVMVSIPYTPNAQELENPDHIVVWYVDDASSITTIPNGRYDAASGSVVFRTTHFSTFAVASVFKTFGDLQNVPWAREAIEVMAARDVIHGTSEDSYTPAEAITRADFVALLIRALELQGTGRDAAMFEDVSSSAYYAHELRIAKELGIVSGTGNNVFRPEDSISRQDMMVLAERALTAVGKPVDADGSLEDYADTESITPYARDSATALVKSGIVHGKDGTLAPHDLLTRAEAAVILYRIWKR